MPCNTGHSSQCTMDVRYFCDCSFHNWFLSSNFRISEKLVCPQTLQLQCTRSITRRGDGHDFGWQLTLCVCSDAFVARNAALGDACDTLDIRTVKRLRMMWLWNFWSSIWMTFVDAIPGRWIALWSIHSKWNFRIMLWPIIHWEAPLITLWRLMRTFSFITVGRTIEPLIFHLRLSWDPLPY